jgi:hypothetical protein
MNSRYDIVEHQPESSWSDAQTRPYAGGFWFYLDLLLKRHVMLTTRNSEFVKARIMQTLINSAITASLYNNLDTTDTQTRMSFIFSSALTPALVNMSMIPIIMEQRSVFYKQSDAYFYPTSAFAIVQTVVLIPLQILECILFACIMYFSVGKNLFMYIFLISI